MGRHSATDGASAHPLVAAALAQRPADGTPTHHGAAASSAEGGGLGWPVAPEEPEPGGGGLGWPDEDAEEQAAADGPAPVPTRRGWRRLFGAAPAA